MAFEYFARARVEFGVFEVGLGGRLDATNILTPVVSVVTRVDFDHENFLGHSLAEIAAEKAGILKPSVPVVVAEQRPEALEVIRARARELGCPLIETSAAFRIEKESMENGCSLARVVEAETGWIHGACAATSWKISNTENSLNAVAAARNYLQKRGYRISDDAITQGNRRKPFGPGAWRRCSLEPDVYLDGAHNPSAARELATFLEQNLSGRKIWLVFGALRDKAVDEIAGVLFPHAAEVIFTQPRTTRAISVAQLADITSHHATHFTVVPDAEAALESALDRADTPDVIVVAGSRSISLGNCAAIGSIEHISRLNEKIVE